MMRIVKRMSLVWTALALLALGAVQPAAQAAAAEAKPIALVSFAGYDALKKDLGFVGNLAGMSELAQAAEGLLGLVTRFQGLAGLDKTKPIGAAVFYSEDQKPSGYLFIPVEDVDKLLDVLQDVVVDVEDQGEGYSTFKLKRGPTLTLRETKGWVFISMSKELLADVPADPAALLGDLPKKYDLAMKFNVANVPEALIEQAIAQMRVGAEQAMKRSANVDDEAAEAIRKAFTESTLESIAQAIKDLDSYTVGLAIDDQTRSAYFDVQVDMKDGSKLAEQLNATTENAKPSLLPSLADAARVFNFHINTPIAGEDAKMAVKMIDDGRKAVDAKVEQDVPEEDRTAVKKILNGLLDIAKSTIEGGQINGGAVVTGDGPFSVVVGLHVAEGKKLEGIAKDIIELGKKKSPDFPEVKFDADSKSGVTYHTIPVPQPPEEEAAENFEKFFGTDEVTVGLGFGPKTFVFAIGDDPIAAADGVVTGKPATLPAKTVPMQMQLKVGPIMKMAAEQPGENQAVVKVMADSLADSKKGHINLNVTLVKNGERVRFEIEEGVIAAFGKAVIAASRKGER